MNPDTSESLARACGAGVIRSPLQFVFTKESQVSACLLAQMYLGHALLHALPADHRLETARRITTSEAVALSIG